MSSAYQGKVLDVDLTRGSIESERIPDGVYEQYLGGYGLGARILFDRMPAGADPLGPDNILGFVPGLLSGTGALFAGRWMLVGKSPLTGGWGDANCGGNLGPEIKKSGSDGIFVRGISSKPVYVLIDRGRMELRDAGHLWGLDAVETQARLEEELGGPHYRVACIGQGGERLSLISSVVNDSGRMAARSGLGAVMGSKKLKALVVRGQERPASPDSVAVKRLNSAFLRQMGVAEKFERVLSRLGPIGRVLGRLPFVPDGEGAKLSAMLRRYGTSGITATAAETGDSPVKNWGGVGHVDFSIDSKSWKISDEEVLRYQKKCYRCSLCPLGCGGELAVDEQGCKLESTRKPEYETLASFGPLTLCDDLLALFEANDMCNRAGLDSISAGSTVAFAIECFENGILTAKDTDGLVLGWGSSSAIIALLAKIIEREGIGDVLADGVRVAARKIGNGAEQYAMQVGGQEVPMHDPRLDSSFGVVYQADPTPGRHTAASQINRSLASNTAYVNLANASGLCLFGLRIGCGTSVSDWLNAATGWRRSEEEYLEIGHRILALRQGFNLREGIDPRSIRLPERILGEAQSNNEAMLEDYYRQLRWDPATGRPTRERLHQLGLGTEAEVVCRSER
jgi:aldehyde:ferredoxin oxidoreductase